jgi:AraC-like DNA-binding protein
MGLLGSRRRHRGKLTPPIILLKNKAREPQRNVAGFKAKRRSEDRRLGENSFGIIQVAAEEIRTDASYYFHNRHRPDGAGLAVQLTVKGAAFFENHQGRRLVQPDYAMMFSHSEDSEYGFPSGAAEPYCQQYIEMTDCDALRNVFDRITQDFGSVVYLPEKSEARDLFNEIVERFRIGRFRDRYEEAEILFRMLIAIYRQQVDGTRVQDPIEFGHHFICSRFRNASNLKEIAQLCGITREYFTRGFRRRYKKTPGQMLKRLRLEHAELLLKTTRMPVVDIAAASGFANLNTFGRFFKKNYRLSPSEYRELARRRGEQRRPV